MYNKKIRKFTFKSFKIKYDPIQLFILTLGTFLVAISFYFFFKPQEIVTGGVGGLALIIQEKYKVIKESYTIFILNIILLIISYPTLGKKFFIKTIYASIMLPIFIYLLDTATASTLGVSNADLLLKNVSHDVSRNLIATVLGSVISGLGLGMIFGQGCTTGGSDIVQKILHKYTKIPLSIAIYLVDGSIVLLSLIAFKMENVLYALISIGIIGLTVDKVVLFGQHGYTVFIVSDLYEEIKIKIMEKLDRGLTKIDVEGGYSNRKKKMIICTISRKQIHTITELIKNVDKDAFSFIIETHKVVGSGFEGNEA